MPFRHVPHPPKIRHVSSLGTQSGWKGDQISETDVCLVAPRNIFHQLLRDPEAIESSNAHDIKQNIETHLEVGPGFCIFRGIDLQGLNEVEISTAIQRFSRLVGTALSQTKHGNFLGRVEDIGFNLKNRLARGHQTNAPLLFHSDRCDRTVLLCVRSASSGGENQIVSSIELAKDCLSGRPDLARRLFEPFTWDNRGEQRPGVPLFTHHPVLSQEGEVFVARYLRRFIEDAQTIAGVTPLDEVGRQALDFLDELLAQKGRAFDFKLGCGDIVIINNLVTLHARKSFQDNGAEGERRLLLRVWLSHSSSRPLPDSYGELFGATEPGGVRGGVWPLDRVFDINADLIEII